MGKIKTILIKSKTDNKKLKELEEKLDLSPFTLQVMSEFVDLPENYIISEDLIKEYLKTFSEGHEDEDSIDIMFERSILELLDNDYIEYANCDKAKYRLTSNFTRLINDTKYPKESIKSLSLFDTFIRLSEYVDIMQKPENKRVNLYVYTEKIMEVLNGVDKNYRIVRILDYREDLRDKSNEWMVFEWTSFMILLTTLCDYVVHKKLSIGISEFNPYLKDRVAFKSFLVSFRYHTNPLFKFDFLKDGEKVHEYVLTDRAKQEFLSDILEIENKNKNRDINLIQPKKIKKKSLFFDIRMSEKVSDLYKFFSESKYNEIISGLVEQGFKPGFTCLFYGNPGTGKTETVYQIAKETNREIMFVDISSMRDKWVGESEKNLKKIFVSYKKLARNSEREPILLFNEADALFGTRLEKTSSSVDNMENAMQNILLQEMEDFEGILIATTNLQGNLDKAFERRFLYKLEFSVPSVETRERIWISKINSIQEEHAHKLAKEYNFSGGQIDNIAKKYIIGKILKGDTEDAIDEYCKEELINKREKIGF